VLIHLSPRAVYALSGADRVRFLNGQLTNDILRLAESHTIHACALNAKGKLEGDLFVTAWTNEMFLDWDAVLTEKLVPRLERYMIADDVELELRDYRLYHSFEAIESGQLPPEMRAASSERFRKPGFDLFVPESIRADLSEILHRPVLSEAETEVLRIEQGLPKWGAELNENVIPVEAGLDRDAINYEKGCYLGQEVISRIRSIGHVNRHLRGVLQIAGNALVVGARLLAGEQKEIGQVTSTASSPRLGKTIGLAFVRRGFGQPGSRYSLKPPESSSGSGEVEISELPFATK
jgi:folate-binding protein YgfZ